MFKVRVVSNEAGGVVRVAVAVAAVGGDVALMVRAMLTMLTASLELLSPGADVGGVDIVVETRGRRGANDVGGAGSSMVEAEGVR